MPTFILPEKGGLIQSPRVAARPRTPNSGQLPGLARPLVTGCYSPGLVPPAASSHGAAAFSTEHRHGMTQATYEVMAIRYATRLTSRRECFLNYHLYHEPDADLVMDYYVWVVRNGDRTIVVDTGFTEEVGVRRHRTMLRDPIIGLRQLGIEMVSLPQLVLTHAHYDHAGNVRHFERAKSSWRDASSSSGPARLGAGSSLPFDGGCRHRAPPDPRCGIEVPPGRRPLPPRTRHRGHRVERSHPRSACGQVATDGGSVVLASDAMHYDEEVERDRPFAIVADLEGMYRSFDALREMQSQPGCVLVAGHDPAVMTRFPTLAGQDGLAVRDCLANRTAGRTGSSPASGTSGFRRRSQGDV